MTIDNPVAAAAAHGLSRTLLVYDAYHDVLDLADRQPLARQVVDSWATAEWFTEQPPLPEAITVTVFKVEGETNTDDLSPATHATTRPDIPLHAMAMLETRMPGGLDLITQLNDNGSGASLELRIVRDAILLAGLEEQKRDGALDEADLQQAVAACGTYACHQQANALMAG